MRGKPQTRQHAKAMRRKMTRAETILWTRLKGRQLHGFQFRRQLVIGPYIADFACEQRRLVIEVDGATHSTPVERVHDEVRRRFIEGQGWVIRRFWNGDIYENEDGVVASILDYLPADGP
jgi:very-short-patch-repair endonuclease